jgi:hypothetical protein
MQTETPDEMLNGTMQCNQCDHVVRYFQPMAGLMEMQEHCEKEHGISEEEFAEQFER